MGISGMSYEVMYDGSGQGEVGDRSSAQVRYLIAWNDLYEFLLALTGGWSQSNANVWVYTAPERHPEISNFWCKSATWVHLGEPTVNGKNVSWEAAVVTATFEPLPYDPTTTDPKDIITEDLEFDSSVITIPQEAITLSPSAGVPAQTIYPDPIQKIIPCCHYILTLEQSPELPGGDASRILQMLGTPVNSKPFRGAAPGLMRFNGVHASRSATAFETLGRAMFKFSLSFTYRPIPWNQKYDRAGNLMWIHIGNGAEPLYKSGDFNTLIPPFQEA